MGRHCWPVRMHRSALHLCALRFAESGTSTSAVLYANAVHYYGETGVCRFKLLWQNRLYGSNTRVQNHPNSVSFAMLHASWNLGDIKNITSCRLGYCCTSVVGFFFPTQSEYIRISWCSFNKIKDRRQMGNRSNKIRTSIQYQSQSFLGSKAWSIHSVETKGRGEGCKGWRERISALSRSSRFSVATVK